MIERADKPGTRWRYGSWIVAAPMHYLVQPDGLWKRVFADSKYGLDDRVYMAPYNLSKWIQVTDEDLAYAKLTGEWP